MLHARPGIFAIPNPWDAGSAKILALLGFEALATTSAGFAFSVGKPDAEGALNRADTLANARAIVDATTLPVSADLENGFGDDPDTCAETIRFIHSRCRSSASRPPSRRRAPCPFHSC
jgi:2-methylisocitrate lyase-like PEP mutase family enzyme